MRTIAIYSGIFFFLILLGEVNQVTAGPDLSDDKPTVTREIRPFGIGMRVATFTKLEIYGVLAPSTLISLVITPHKNFRVEPEIGYYSSKVYDISLKEDLADKSLHLGLGIYGMINKGATNIYLGFRAATVKFTEEFVNFDFPTTPPFVLTTSKDELVSKQLLVGIVIGGEYLFSNHFSFGGEIGFKRSTYHSNTETGHNHNEDTTTYLLTDSGLFVRFYF